MVRVRYVSRLRYASKIELKYGTLVRYGSRCEVRSTQILNVLYRTAILAPGYCYLLNIGIIMLQSLFIVFVNLLRWQAPSQDFPRK